MNRLQGKFPGHLANCPFNYADLLQEALCDSNAAVEGEPEASLGDSVVGHLFSCSSFDHFLQVLLKPSFADCSTKLDSTFLNDEGPAPLNAAIQNLPSSRVLCSCSAQILACGNFIAPPTTLHYDQV